MSAQTMARSSQSFGISPLTVSESEDDNNSLVSHESLGPNAMVWMQKEYWLGQKYFSYVQAEHILRTSHPEESLSELDVRRRAKQKLPSLT
jgi:hypothetical protein